MLQAHRDRDLEIKHTPRRPDDSSARFWSGGSKMKMMGPREYPKDWSSSCLWDGKISVHLGYPSHGWVLLSLLTTAYNGSLVIHLSEVFDPFWEMVDWLKAIAEGNLPASFTIDEEGRCKEFIASSLAVESAQGSDIEFRVNGDFWNQEKEQLEERCCFLTKATRKQLLDEFSSRLESWLSRDYDQAGWLGGDPDILCWDLRKLDLEGLKQSIQNMG